MYGSWRETMRVPKWRSRVYKNGEYHLASIMAWLVAWCREPLLARPRRKAHPPRGGAACIKPLNIESRRRYFMRDAVLAGVAAAVC